MLCRAWLAACVEENGMSTRLRVWLWIDVEDRRKIINLHFSLFPFIWPKRVIVLRNGVSRKCGWLQCLAMFDDALVLSLSFAPKHNKTLKGARIKGHRDRLKA
jgi:hypothetical protein